MMAAANFEPAMTMSPLAITELYRCLMIEPPGDSWCRLVTSGVLVVRVAE